MRNSKGVYEIYVKNSKGEADKKTVVRFPSAQDEIKAYDLTYPRAAIITARSVSKECCNIKESGEIRMSALALNVGWHGLFITMNYKKLDALVSELKLEALSMESLYLCSIPRIRPHRFLNMNTTEKYRMLIFCLYSI